MSKADILARQILAHFSHHHYCTLHGTVFMESGGVGIGVRPENPEMSRWLLVYRPSPHEYTRLPFSEHSAGYGELPSESVVELIEVHGHDQQAFSDAWKEEHERLDALDFFC